MNDTNKSTFFTANFMFMVLAYAFIFGSLIMAVLEVNFKMSIIVIQYGIIFLPILIVMLSNGISIKEKFRFNPIKLSTVLKTIGITLTALPIAYTLNFIVNVILIKLDLFQVQTLDLGTGVGNYVIIVLLVAVTPGIVEEFFFRGLMFSSYREKMNPTKAIIFTGLFFGLFHFNLQNLMLPAFLGMVFAWLVYITDSIYTSMIAHGLFNFIGSIIMYSNQSTAATEDLDTALVLLDEQAGIILISLIVVSAISGAAMFALMYWLKSDFIKVKIGDTITIKDHKMLITDVDEEGISVVHNDENKKISFKTLKKLNHKIDKLKVEYGSTSSWNTLFVLMVVILYVGFMFLSYS